MLGDTIEPSVSVPMLNAYSPEAVPDAEPALIASPPAPIDLNLG